jgi:hypothetical protein
MIFKPTDQPASQTKKRKANSPIKPPNPTPITIDETTDLRTIMERLGTIIGSLPEHQQHTIDKAIELIGCVINNITPKDEERLTQLETNQKNADKKLDRILANLEKGIGSSPTPSSRLTPFPPTVPNSVPSLRSLATDSGLSNKHSGHSTYAQVAGRHASNPLHVEDGFTTVGPRRHQSGNQQNTKTPFTSYRDKRIVLLGSSEALIDGSPKEVRDRINSQLREKLNITTPIISSIFKSQQGKNIVLIINDGHNLEDVLNASDIIRPHFEHSRMKIDVQWSKILVNGLLISDWNDENTGMEDLQTELMQHSGIQLAAKPRWITSKEARQTKTHGSVVLSFDEPTMHQRALRTLHSIGSQRVTTRLYREARITDQCGNCWRHGHNRTLCRSESRCQYCTEPHQTSQHCCRICNKKGECEHNQCVNCDGKHDATNRRCTEWTTVYQKQANFNTRKREASQLQKDADADILNGPTTNDL